MDATTATDAAPQATEGGIALYMQSLTVSDVYMMGLSFVAGSIMTVLLLLILDMLKERRRPVPFAPDVTDHRGNG